MTDRPIILAIDAATYYGFAVGPAGEPPRSGSAFFAKSGRGASRGAVFWGAMQFTAAMVKEHGKPLHIVIEAPLPTVLVNGNTNVSTTEILMGLPAVIEGMAHGLGCFNVSVARVAAIRKHFIGKGNIKGEIAKPLVLRKCIDLGWISMKDDDVSHDRSDACALWSYAEHQLFPRGSQPVDDLFVRAQARKRGL